jgi:hypothetical protein
MKNLKYIFSALLALLLTVGCSDDEVVDIAFASASNTAAPTNINALLDITQDNTGLVTITPSGENSLSFEISFGDGTVETETVKPGANTSHTYPEGTYDISVTGLGLNNLEATTLVPLTVSFKAPENLVVEITNDLAISKQVNVTANADFGVTFDVYFGETGNDTPVSANIGETASYIYQEAGTYSIRVVAKSAAIAMTEETQDFEATAIVQPVQSAPSPPFKNAGDVISIYTAAYDNVAGTNFNPDWGQSGQGSSYAEFDLNGDKMLQYINLSYQGIGIGETIDVSGMEFLHLDIWTADVTKIETSLINGVDGDSTEKPVWTDLTADQWTTVDIPLAEYTGQGLTIDQIFQLKFVGEPWAAGTVFIDNIYFWKTSTAPEASNFPLNFEYPFGLSSFDGGEISAVANPDTDGNSSSTVAQLIKGSGQTWAGSKITVDQPYSLNSDMSISAKIWSPRAGLTLTMKFEDEIGWPDTKATAEVVATTTTANAWEDVTFNFTGIDTSINWYNLVLFIDNGTVGDGSADYTIYLDDISVATFLNFEHPFNLSSFDGGEISIIANPDTEGNASSYVAQMIKGDGATWAGSKVTANTPFELNENISFSAKIWSPRAGLTFTMKFEDEVGWPDTKATAEVVATTTSSNEWETITFNFTGVDTSIDWYNLVLFIDNGTVGDGSANYTIYLDDITQL